VTLGTRRLLGGIAVLLTLLLVFHFIPAELFGSLMHSLLSLFALS
jgi:hypothetical protein